MLRQPGTSPQPLRRKHRGRFFVEQLEDRNLLSCGPGGPVLEAFDGGDLSNYTTIVRYYPSAYVFDGGAGCDGGAVLVDYDGDDWIIRDQPATRVAQGDRISAWVYLGSFTGGPGDGRAYFGFGSVA